ncbi:hypothetical protein AAFC00_003894 [Neodothiora populina]|uniref:Pkinase-domain-containing protein n=1 Tax=Neodothiora populina TaxID=2781224 RepID=A0ABR3PGY2_9PEZI
MPQSKEQSLKRARGSSDDAASDSQKKPRRSDRLSGKPDATDRDRLAQTHLPSPVTRKASNSTEEQTKTPPVESRHQDRQPTPDSSPIQSGLNSPPSDTQPYSQFLPPPPISYEVEDEEAEGVWGYLIPVEGDAKSSKVLVLRKRAACPVSGDKVGKTTGKNKVKTSEYTEQENNYESEKATKGVPAGGYLLGRHPECDRVIHSPTVSNRHCLLFNENKNGDSIAVLEDLSGNGTYVNDAYVGRNKRRDLQDGDEVSVLDAARFIFRYPRVRDSNGFRQQYTIQGQLGKGHFATVFLCTEKCSGLQYAVKRFEKRRVGNSQAAEEKSRVEGLQQEIAVLMGVSHPNVLCLKDTYDETDGVYLVLELAPEGELFNWIVAKQKLSEADTRKIFVQLFQGMKYLHERNIVHRDIKPENILLIDKDLHVKIADFGLAKIIGEESFTSTLCGTPSYVAPEILEPGNRRRYTRAVDVWSLGVVLYICLCGFPPFSDELCTRDNPYNLSQQIKLGRFDYPSPYWDSVGDPALDLIDKMLTVDVEKRISIDECLEHPWTTGQVGGPPGKDGVINPGASMESTDGLTGAMGKLDFSKRKPVRERTLLSSLNDVSVVKVIDAGDKEHTKVKVWEKNNDKTTPSEKTEAKKQEITPGHERDPKEFVKMGGAVDEPLFGNDNASHYQDQSMKPVED